MASFGPLSIGLRIATANSAVPSENFPTKARNTSQTASLSERSALQVLEPRRTHSVPLRLSAPLIAMADGSAGVRATPKARDSKKRAHAELDAPPNDTTATKRARRNHERLLPPTSLSNGSRTLIERDSPFVTARTSVCIPLSPVGLSQPLESLCAEHLSPLLLTYHHPLRGVLLSYSDVQLSTKAPPSKEYHAFATAHAEYGTPYTWLTATFTLFRPRKGTKLQGYVNVVSSNHVGLICYNLFNASVERRHMPRNWKWVSSLGPASDHGGGGFWSDCDANANALAAEAPLEFRVRDFESVGFGGGATARERAGFLTVEGTMLSDEELTETERISNISAAATINRPSKTPASVSVHGKSQQTAAPAKKASIKARSSKKSKENSG